MQTRTPMLIAALVALPLTGWATEPASSPTPGNSFDIHGDFVRKVINDTAASQYATDAGTAVQPAPAKSADPGPVTWQQPESPRVVVTPRLVDHFDCDARDCVARDPQHHAVYVLPSRLTNESVRLACQARDALPGAAQGYEKCTNTAVSAQMLDDDAGEPSLGERLLGEAVLSLFEKLFD